MNPDNWGQKTFQNFLQERRIIKPVIFYSTIIVSFSIEVNLQNSQDKNHIKQFSLGNFFPRSQGHNFGSQKEQQNIDFTGVAHERKF